MKDEMICSYADICDAKEGYCKHQLPHEHQIGCDEAQCKYGSLACKKIPEVDEIER